MKEYIVQAIEQETIDTFDAHNAQELIRCKECSLRECDGRPGNTVCGITGEQHSDEWFCADGERK